jgi:hypothetical protein
MSRRIEGITGRIGVDSPTLDTPNGYECIITASYPNQSSNELISDTTPLRTVFNKKDIFVYRSNPDGGISKIQAMELPPEEYVFSATVTMPPSGFARMIDIVVTNIKK